MFRTNRQYLEHVWWVMHHSDDESRSSAFVTCYVDESSTDDAQTAHGILGGVVLNREGFLDFDDQWADLLERFAIEQPLHMKEMGRGLRLGHLSACQREKLLCAAVALVNRHKILSISTVLNNREFDQHIAPLVKEQYSVYALSFMAMVVTNKRNADANSFSGRVAYMFDQGNRYRHHVLKAHAALQETAAFDNRTRLGSLTFEYDTFVSALQAADMVAWSARRRAAGLAFRGGREPLMDLFQSDGHLEPEITPEVLQKLSERLRMRIENKGEV